MRVTLDYHEFFVKTGMVLEPERIRALGVRCEDYIGGTFWPREKGELLDFCAFDWSFHIVTYLDNGIMVNRYHEQGGLFFLADGYRNPNYWLDDREGYYWLIPSNKDQIVKFREF